MVKAQEFSGLRMLDGVCSAKTKVPSHAHEQAVFCIALKGTCNEVYAGQVRNYEGRRASLEIFDSQSIFGLRETARYRRRV